MYQPKEQKIEILSFDIRWGYGWQIMTMGDVDDIFPILAVVTLRTFALGKLDLLTVLPRET